MRQVLWPCTASGELSQPTLITTKELMSFPDVLLGSPVLLLEVYLANGAHTALWYFPSSLHSLSQYEVDACFKYVSVLSCQPMVHLPNYWAPQRSTSTKGKQNLVISPEVPHLFIQSSSTHIHVAVIRTKSELEPRLGGEEVLFLLLGSCWTRGPALKGN